MKTTEKSLQAFNQICQEWEKAGLDFKRTILAFTPPGNSPEELRTDSIFKNLASKELEKKV